MRVNQILQKYKIEKVSIYRLRQVIFGKYKFFIK